MIREWAAAEQGIRTGRPGAADCNVWSHGAYAVSASDHLRYRPQLGATCSLHAAKRSQKRTFWAAKQLQNVAKLRTHLVAKRLVHSWTSATRASAETFWADATSVEHRACLFEILVCKRLGQISPAIGFGLPRPRSGRRLLTTCVRRHAHRGNPGRQLTAFRTTWMRSGSRLTHPCTIAAWTGDTSARGSAPEPFLLPCKSRRLEQDHRPRQPLPLPGRADLPLQRTAMRGT